MLKKIRKQLQVWLDKLRNKQAEIIKNGKKDNPKNKPAKKKLK